MIKHIWRISCVNMYYSVMENQKTPSPYAELRSYIFLKYRPTIVQMEIIRKKLLDNLRLMENSLQGIRGTLIKEYNSGEDIIDREHVEDDDKPSYNRVGVDTIEVEKADGKGEIVMKINGYEVEDVDSDEVLKGIEHIARKGIQLGMPYNYASFREVDGSINWEANDDEISQMIQDFLDEGEEPY